MNIYISDKSKKEEVWKLRKYWEETWFPTIQESLYDFCVKTNGQIVNKELAEGILEDVIGNFQYSPISNTLYQEIILTINHTGVFWRNHVLDGIMISNLTELVRFFNESENQNKYLLEDDNGNVYSLSELSDKINHLRQ